MTSPRIASRLPRKFLVEPTTRCNLKCAMCVREAGGCRIPEADLDPAQFERLAPALPTLSSLVFGGLGEPLLHPGLADMIRFARSRMPAKGRIKLQTNGWLLTAALAGELALAGLTDVCISVETLGGGPAANPAEEAGHGPRQTAAAVSALTEARAAGLRTGVQFTLMSGNLGELPDLPGWAAARGASFAIVSHLLPYAAGTECHCAFDWTSDRARESLETAVACGEIEPGDPAVYADAPWRYVKTPVEQAAVNRMHALAQRLSREGVSLRLDTLRGRDAALAERLAEAMDKAQAGAKAHGVELALPAREATFGRACAFIDEEVACVASDGAVSACPLLWHDTAFRVRGEPVRAARRVFGRLDRDDIAAVWQGSELTSFREQAATLAVPSCYNCSCAPCDDIQGISHPFEIDCYGTDIPCGFCPWPLGGFACLR